MTNSIARGIATIFSQLKQVTLLGDQVEEGNVVENYRGKVVPERVVDDGEELVDDEEESVATGAIAHAHVDVLGSLISLTLGKDIFWLQLICLYFVDCA